VRSYIIESAFIPIQSFCVKSQSTNFVKILVPCLFLGSHLVFVTGICLLTWPPLNYIFGYNLGLYYTCVQAALTTNICSLPLSCIWSSNALLNAILQNVACLKNALPILYRLKNEIKIRNFTWLLAWPTWCSIVLLLVTFTLLLCHYSCHLWTLSDFCFDVWLNT
jgi:hypothetical protein